MRGRGISGNPVLIGAATVLVILVAVFLSYNANQGLPFVPSYSLKAQAPSAANLVRGNEVRIGGTRVGTVDSIGVERLEDGASVALLGLKLERAVAPLPVDSTLMIRPRSALGLKYVEIMRGTSQEGFAEGATIPLAQATPAPVEFDEFTNMFDEETRDAAQINLREFGDAFAGRGASLNQAIGALRPLLRDVIPVARNLASRETGLPRFIGALSRAARIVSPAAEAQAELFVNLDRTFGALRRVARPYIQETIEEGPATLDAAIESLPPQRPFLINSAALFRELQPAARELLVAAPETADALQAGTPTLRALPPFNRRLASLLDAIDAFAQDPLVPQGISSLNETVRTLQPTLSFLAPAQITCNYLGLWFRNVSSLLSEGDSNGTWQRFIIVATPQGPNNEGTLASAPANGPTAENRLRTNPYPHTASPGQPRECEAGNEPFPVNQQVLSNPPGTQSATTQSTAR